MDYTYTIFDSDPSTSGPCAWPSHTEVEIEAATPTWRGGYRVRTSEVAS